MKLPSGVKSGVQRLQGGSVSDVVRTGDAWAGASQTISNALAGVHAENQRKKDDSQIRQADLEYSAAMTDFETQYAGREFFSSDEIPENIDVRRTERSTGLNGVTVENPRSNIPAYEVYANMYHDFSKKTSDSISSTIDQDESRDKWHARATIVGNNQYTNRAIASSSQQEAHINAQLDAQIQSATKDRNYGVAMHLAADIPNELKRKEITTAIGAQQEVDTINDLIMAEAETDEDLTEAETEMARLRSDDYTGDLGVSERNAFANSLEAATAEHEASMVSREKRENAQIVSDTWRSIDTLSAQGNEHTIQTLFDDGLISGGEMTNMKRTLERNRKQAVKSQIDKQYVLDGNPIDPKDKPSRDAVNALYTDAIAQPDADPKTIAIDFMKQFKIVPDDVISTFRANNRADAPQMATAANMLIYAQDFASQSLNDFKPNEIDVLEKVAANMRLGMDTPSAIAAVTSYSTLSPDQKATLNRNSKVMAGENTTSLDEQISDHPAYDVPWSIFDPEMPAFMDSEFSAMVSRHLPDVGFDMKVAQKLAFADVAKRWQLSDINGDHELMKFAPQGKTEVIRSAITKQYKGVMAEISQLTDGRATAKNIRIASDSMTAIQVSRGMKPSYTAFVVVDSDTGEIVKLPRFTWDSAAANIAEKAKLVQKGKDARKAKKAALAGWKRTTEEHNEAARVRF